MEKIKEFCMIMDEIMLDLRFLRGLDNEKACKFSKILQEIIDEWKDETYVPKILCNMFIDFYPSAEASACLYDEREKSKILQFADEITELMRICVDTTSEEKPY